jgi:methionyl-tRNA formyltransferase
MAHEVIEAYWYNEVGIVKVMTQEGKPVMKIGTRTDHDEATSEQHIATNGMTFEPDDLRSDSVENLINQVAKLNKEIDEMWSIIRDINSAESCP